MKRPDWSREKAFRIDEDGCLIWRGSVHTCGMPTIHIPGTSKRRYASVRRSVCAMVLGRALQHTERVIVDCGKERCCSPKCVRAVGYRDLNKRTAAETGYAQNHTRCARISATLSKRWRWTAEQVADMRARDAAGEDRSVIAADYGTTRDRLNRIFAYRAQVRHLDPAMVAQVKQQLSRG